MSPLSRYKMQQGQPRPASDAQPVIQQDIYGTDEQPPVPPQPNGYPGQPQQAQQPRPYMGPQNPSPVPPTQGAAMMPPAQNMIPRQRSKLPNTKRGYM